ncbi:MAG: hypothetical protein JWQ30_559 [Sediminibacterium sp.]|nr:hypothetical protein [Sediminibacterium sp.]
MRSVSTIIARLCLALLPVFFLLSSEAQQNSPFTRYGLGEYYTNQHIISRSLGGLTAAYADGANNNVGQSINFSNPATYSQMYMVNFDLGLTIDSRSLASKTPTSKFTTNNFIPSYIAIGVPLKKAKGWGMAFGLKPLSTVSYSIETRERIANDSLQTIYEGSGGLNQVFVGIGKRWKGFSLGFNTGYNFGRKDITTRKAFINDTVAYYQSKTSTVTNFGGAFLDGGMQYEFSVAKKVTVATKTTENYLLRFGLTGGLQQKLSATQDQLKQTYTVGTAGDIKIDSVSELHNIKGTVNIPSTYAAGITLHKATTGTRGTFEMWSIGMEYTATQWSNYRFYDQADRLSNSWQFKVGAQFCPDPLSGIGYWNNVNYRIGFMTGKDYLNPDGNGLKHYAVSFGAGLPIRKWRAYDNQFTFLNTALQFGKRGSAVNNITESYFQFSLGISLSDLWFVPRKYD